jgi:hypothetical protein
MRRRSGSIQQHTLPIGRPEGRRHLHGSTATPLAAMKTANDLRFRTSSIAPWLAGGRDDLESPTELPRRREPAASPTPRRAPRMQARRKERNGRRLPAESAATLRPARKPRRPYRAVQTDGGKGVFLHCRGDIARRGNAKPG